MTDTTQNAQNTQAPRVTDQPLTQQELAQLIAADIEPGSFVNLGIGQPTTVSDYLSPEKQVTLHTENGMRGMGPQGEGFPGRE